MAPEEPQVTASLSAEDDISLLAILAVQTNGGNLENVDWDQKAAEMSLERGYNVTAAECRTRTTELIEATTRALQAIAARRRNTNPGNTQPSNSAPTQPGSSNNVPQGQNVPNGGAQSANSSNGVAHPTPAGDPRSATSSTSAADFSNHGEEAGAEDDEGGEN